MKHILVMVEKYIMYIIFTLVIIFFAGLFIFKPPAPPEVPAKFEIGQSVHIKSGSPKMSIYSKADKIGKGWVYYVTYADTVGVVHDAIEPETILEPAN